MVYWSCGPLLALQDPVWEPQEGADPGGEEMPGSSGWDSTQGVSGNSIQDFKKSSVTWLFGQLRIIAKFLLSKPHGSYGGILFYSFFFFLISILTVPWHGILHKGKHTLKPSCWISGASIYSGWKLRHTAF